MASTEIAIVRQFIASINAHDIDAMFELLTDDHVFVDAMGQAIRRPNLLEPWSRYFATFPDYRISVTHLMQEGEVVGVFGKASAGSGDAGAIRSRWELPAAWRAVVREGRIAVWQVYADNEPVRRILRR